MQKVKLFSPGFINTHNHLFQTLLKGLGDDMVLKDWLATMTFPAAKFITREDTYYAAMQGCIEGLCSGITTMVDYMYPHNRENLSDGIIDAFKRTWHKRNSWQRMYEHRYSIWCSYRNNAGCRNSRKRRKKTI